VHCVAKAFLRINIYTDINIGVTSIESPTNKLPPFLFERRIGIKEQSLCFSVSVERPFEPCNRSSTKRTTLLLPERASVTLVNTAFEYWKVCWEFLVIILGLDYVRSIHSECEMRQ
jgi:hypothetical protein